MSTQERRAREVAAREQLFLEAARKLIARDGLLNLQMSRIPEMCDYAVGTFYQHFSSREDLLVTLASVNNKKLKSLFEKVVDWHASTRDRMFGLVMADALFFRNHPEHYRITQFAFTEAVWNAATPERRAQALEAGRPVGDIVNRLVQEAIDVGDVEPRGLNASELALAVWSQTVGMHSLMHTQGLLEQYEVHDPHTLVARHLQALLNGLDWKPLVDLTEPEMLETKLNILRKEVLHEFPD